MKRAAVLAALMVALAGAHANASPPIPIDGIAAVVDDVVLFRSDVVTRMHMHESQLSKDPTKRSAELAELYYVTVRRMVEEALIAKDAQRLHIVVSDADVAIYVKQLDTWDRIAPPGGENMPNRFHFVVNTDALARDASAKIVDRFTT